MGGTWHGIHGKIDDRPHRTRNREARGLHRHQSGRDCLILGRLHQPVLRSGTDSIILAPVFAFTVASVDAVTLSNEFFGLRVV